LEKTMRRSALISLTIVAAAGAWLAAIAMGPHAMSREPRFPQLTMEQLNDKQRPLGEAIMKVSSVGLGGP
jgi:4-carboxymuconolactone decarboxylase